MGIFELMEENGHEEILFCYNKPTRLKAIIAIHNTTLGSAVGGCRLWKYASEEDALVDALVLSRVMTYQSAVADSDTGGGKAVLWKDFEEETDPAVCCFIIQYTWAKKIPRIVHLAHYTACNLC